MTNPTDDRPTWTDPAPTTTTPLPAAQPLAPGTSGTPSAPPASPASAATPSPAVPPAATAAVPPVAPVVVSSRSSSGGRWVNLLLGIAAVIAVGGVAFAIGRSTAPASAASIGTFPGGNGSIALSPGGSFDPNGGPVVNGGPRGLFGNGGPTIDGKVASITGDTLTITLPSGDSMTVKLDGDTTYHQSTDATASDVAIGDDVAVRVDGGRIQIGNGNANGNANGGDTPDLTASDITVSQ